MHRLPLLKVARELATALTRGSPRGEWTEDIEEAPADPLSRK